MKNKTINGKKISYSVSYSKGENFGKEESHYDGYSIREVKFIIEGKEYLTQLKTFWNKKRTLVIDEFKIGKSVLPNEKQVIEYILKIK